jgi:hypothetical protein
VTSPPTIADRRRRRNKVGKDLRREDRLAGPQPRCTRELFTLIHHRDGIYNTITTRTGWKPAQYAAATNSLIDLRGLGVATVSALEDFLMLMKWPWASRTLLLAALLRFWFTFLFQFLLVLFSLYFSTLFVLYLFFCSTISASSADKGVVEAGTNMEQ